MNKNAERFIVAGILSYITALLALQFGPDIMWVRVVFGATAFVAGYIGYDFRAVLDATPNAFTKACAGVRGKYPTKEGIWQLSRYTFYTFGAIASLCLTLFGILGTALFLSGMPVSATAFQAAAMLSTAASSFITIFLLGADNECLDFHVAYMSDVVRWAHPISFICYTVPIILFKALYLIARATELGCEFGWKFFWCLYQSIHSTPRVLFGLDAAIGFSLGYHYGNALLGGFAGAAWWILDWHVISVKLMRAQPAQ